MSEDYMGRLVAMMTDEGERDLSPNDKQAISDVFNDMRKWRSIAREFRDVAVELVGMVRWDTSDDLASKCTDCGARTPSPHADLCAWKRLDAVVAKVPE